MILFFLYLFPFFALPGLVMAQTFETFPANLIQGTKPLFFNDILPTTKGTVMMATSFSDLLEFDKMLITVTPSSGYPVDDKGRKIVYSGRSDVYKDLYELNAGIKFITEGPGRICYFVTDNNHFGYVNYNYGRRALGFPPFIFPENREQPIDIRKIWMDAKGNLFIGTNYDTLYIIQDAANVAEARSKKYLVANFTTGFDKDSNIIVIEGAKKIRKVFLGKGIIPCSFATSADDDDQILIGTNHGLYAYEKSTGLSTNIFSSKNNEPLNITHISVQKTSAFIWFSTLEKGMGRAVNGLGNPVQYFPYKKNGNNSIKTFCRKSAHEFFVAPMDSIPAVFNTETGSYTFISDTTFSQTKNSTTDIKIDAGGSLYVIKDGWLFIAKSIVTNPAFADVKWDSTVAQAIIIGIQIGNMSYSDLRNTQIDFETLDEIRLRYYENNVGIVYHGRGFTSRDTIEFASKLEGHSDDWVLAPFSFLDEKLNMTSFANLRPGKYLFRVKFKNAGEDWRKPEARLTIIIDPPFWQTWWFWTSATAGISLFTFLVSSIRARVIRKQEREKVKHEKELLELEAKALRAQMNPHFIFNCMNSIKSLIQQHEEEKAVTYLTTFSKLIRTLFNNADKKEISLYDEIETCKLYLQLEAMRFDTKFSYSVNVDENIDLKSLQVPALIIQPFIENAIWHGLVPKGGGGNVSLSVIKSNGNIEIVIEDDGIGRESSRQNKATSGLAHQSKGVNLTQSRLELDNLLQQRKAELEIIDKKDENGKTAGTKVVFKIVKEL